MRTYRTGLGSPAVHPFGFICCRDSVWTLEGVSPVSVSPVFTVRPQSLEHTGYCVPLNTT
uniref:Uncharacterized protein n=1 Tax=Anguilla anguilla TaxID=7936 RepID=A0A0E9XJ05_ANGAN